MKQCDVCTGLVPDKSVSCPNCEVKARSTGRRLVKTATFTAVLMTTSFCAPIYGAPCVTRADGGNSCNDGLCDAVRDEPQADGGLQRDNPESACYVPDGGAP